VTRIDRNKGFTLYELMVTLAVGAVIVSFGVPGFSSMVQNNRAVTHSNDLITALNLARSEATRRGVAIQLCSSTDGASCSGSNDWSTGWIVRHPGGDVLRAWSERSGGAGVLTANVSQFRFQGRGALASAPLPVLQVRLPDCSGDQGRDISVNVAGRISVTRVAC